MKLDIKPGIMSQVVEALGIGSELFWDPVRLVEQAAWVGHIPFASWLVKAVRPDTLVELGSHSGNSYAAFCQAIMAHGLPARAYAVDTWLGDQHSGLYDESVFAELNAFNNAHFSHFSQLLRTTFDAARAYFSPGTVDLLHIDGLHTYDAVRHDFEHWVDVLSSRAIVVFHDINVRENDFGVWRFWEEMTQQYPSFTFDHSHGLGVLGVGPEQPAAIKNLFHIESAPETATMTRNLFASRGEIFQRRIQVMQSGRRVTALEAEIARAAEHATAGLVHAESLRDNLHAAEARSAALDQELGNLRAEISSLGKANDDTSQRLQRQIAGQRDEIANRWQEIAALRDEIAGLVAVREGMQVEHQRELSRLTAEAAATCAYEVARYRESTSWRITAPLRATVLGLRGQGFRS